MLFSCYSIHTNLVGAAKPTIGEGVEEINAEINYDYLQRKRGGKASSGKKELESISEEATKEETSKKEKKKTKGQIEYEEQCKTKWKKLSTNFLCSLEIPINILTLPSRATTLRGLQAQVVEHEVGPRLWEQNVNAQDKGSIVCLFEVHSNDFLFSFFR